MDIKQNTYSVYQTLREPVYLTITILTTLISIIFISAIQNLNLAISSITYDGLTASDRLDLFTDILPIFGKHQMIYEIGIILISILLGINIAMMIKTYNSGKYENFWSSATTGVASFLGIVSVSCVACGVVALGGILSLFGATGILLAMPYQGQELLIPAIILLIISIYLNGRLFNESNEGVCRL